MTRQFEEASQQSSAVDGGTIVSSGSKYVNENTNRKLKISAFHCCA